MVCSVSIVNDPCLVAYSLIVFATSLPYLLGFWYFTSLLCGEVLFQAFVFFLFCEDMSVLPGMERWNFSKCVLSPCHRSVRWQVTLHSHVSAVSVATGVPKIALWETSCHSLLSEASRPPWLEEALLKLLLMLRYCAALQENVVLRFCCSFGDTWYIAS